MAIFVATSSFASCSSAPLKLLDREGYEVEFEDERVDGNVSELNYFYNLWNETLRHAAKVGGGEPCFDSFMAKIAYDGLDATYRPVGVGA